MEHTDKELIEMCLKGSSDYYRFLVIRYEKPLFAYLLRKLKDKDLASEAAQEAFIRAFTGLSKLKNPDAFNSWLIGIGARVALEIFRDSKKNMETQKEIEDYAIDWAEETQELGLEELIANLPEVQRKAILLRYYQGYSCKEIAETLRVPIGTVTKNLSRAYSTLKENLNFVSSDLVEELA